MPPGTRKDREDSILKVLENAENHKENSDKKWELRCLHNVCNRYARISVDEFNEPEEGIDYLFSKGFPNILDRTINIIAEEHNLYLNSQNRQVTNDISLVHYAWLMSMYEAANLMAKICADESVWVFQPGTKFWNEYRRVVGRYVENKNYEPSLPKLEGYEKYWPPYLALMNAITENKTLEGPLKEIEESFVNRNKDKRLKDYGFDGDGEFPVKWDLRKISILRTAETNQSVS